MARKQEVEINTRLGKRRIDMDKVIYFPRGLAGFEGMHEFTLLQIRPEAPMLILQSMETPTLGLLVADPFSFIKDYRIKISDAEQKLLRLKNVRQVAVLVTVTIPNGKPEETALNLTGPILINHQARVGLQILQAEGENPSQVRIHDIRKTDDAPPSPVQNAAVSSSGQDAAASPSGQKAAPTTEERVKKMPSDTA